MSSSTERSRAKSRGGEDIEVVTYLHMRHILPVLGTWEVALRLLKKEKNIASVSRLGQSHSGGLGVLWVLDRPWWEAQRLPGSLLLLLLLLLFLLFFLPPPPLRL